MFYAFVLDVRRVNGEAQIFLDMLYTIMNRSGRDESGYFAPLQ